MLIIPPFLSANQARKVNNMEKRKPNVVKETFYVCHVKPCKEKEYVFESKEETKTHFKRYHKGIVMVM
jgi:hypothetical protein